MAGPSKGPFRHRSKSKAKSCVGETDRRNGRTLVSPPAEPGVYLSEIKRVTASPLLMEQPLSHGAH